MLAASRSIILAFCTALLTTSCLHSPVQEALIRGHIHADDTLEVKVDKALALLNEKGYFRPGTSATNSGGVAKNSSFEKAYELDSQRTPDEILAQKSGGSSGSSALVFAALLSESGVPENQIQIVGAVINNELSVICPKAGTPRLTPKGTDGNGQAFVALQFPDGKWQIINVVDGPAQYGRAPWFSPEIVRKKIQRQSLEVPRGVFRSLPYKSFESGLTVFQTWSLKQYPRHTAEQRLNLIASGQLKSPARCRFTAPQASTQSIP